MKQPWEVFLESFRYRAPSLDPGAPWDEIRERGNEILNGAHKAEESLPYHLIQAERWKVADAKALAWEFIEATVDWMKKEDKDPSTRIECALRNQWTDGFFGTGETATHGTTASQGGRHDHCRTGREGSNHCEIAGTLKTEAGANRPAGR